MSFAAVCKYTASQDVASCGLGDGAALLDLRSGTYYSINTVARHIWNEIQTLKTASEIASSVEENFAVDRAKCLADVTALLDELSNLGLVERVDDQAA